jgi:hypothetical protein
MKAIKIVGIIIMSVMVFIGFTTASDNPENLVPGIICLIIALLLCENEHNMKMLLIEQTAKMLLIAILMRQV